MEFLWRTRLAGLKTVVLGKRQWDRQCSIFQQKGCHGDRMVGKVSLKGVRWSVDGVFSMFQPALKDL